MVVLHDNDDDDDDDDDDDRNKVEVGVKDKELRNECTEQTNKVVRVKIASIGLLIMSYIDHDMPVLDDIVYRRT